MAGFRGDFWVLAGLFAASGTLHLIRPEVFEPLMPAFVPAHTQVIYASGVAELLCAAGLAYPPTRRIAGWASAALLIAVFPGNIKMAVDAAGSDALGSQVVAFARLPLQLPLIAWALRAGRTGLSSGTGIRRA